MKQHFIIGGPGHGNTIRHTRECVRLELLDEGRTHKYRLMRTNVVANGGPTQRYCEYFVWDQLDNDAVLKLINEFESPSFVDRVLEALLVS